MALWTLYRYETRLAMTSGGGMLTGVIFFLSLVTMIPFAIGPDLPLLAKIGPAILWIGALLSTLLGLDRLFKMDQEDGTLDVLRVSHQPLELIVFVKCAAHWTVSVLPLVIAAPLFGLLLNMEGAGMLSIAGTLLIGTPALTFLGAIGAGLTVGLRRGGLLLPILILPLTIPVVIFGVAASVAGSQIGLETAVNFKTPFLFLCAMTLFSAVLAPIASAWAIRLNDN
ncbi:MAG: heme exporter protein CcmB [Hyphomicrobiales bacterium]